MNSITEMILRAMLTLRNFISISSCLVLSSNELSSLVYIKLFALSKVTFATYKIDQTMKFIKCNITNLSFG